MSKLKLSEEAREARRRYNRRWRERNKERVQENAEKFWEGLARKEGEKKDG